MNRVQGSFITGRPIRKQQKAEAVLSPGGGVGGRCRGGLCAVLRRSLPKQKPWGLGRRVGWGGEPVGSRRMCNVEPEGEPLGKQVRGGVAFTTCLFWRRNHFDKISF